MAWHGLWHGYRGHDCKRAGCQRHVCKPMTTKTIRNVHSILSGAFATAKRWEWIAWNPAESAKPPAVTRRPLPATTPEDVAKVIAEGRKAHPVLVLYLWLVAITGARRGELCADGAAGMRSPLPAGPGRSCAPPPGGRARTPRLTGLPIFTTT